MIGTCIPVVWTVPETYNIPKLLVPSNSYTPVQYLHDMVLQRSLCYCGNRRCYTSINCSLMYHTSNDCEKI